ncbi:MAG: V-type ATP synthase subunit I [Treponema sp.]|jgi:V/A-type H+-transporting ATPase subunit I|nr:V-type ATP synthase subunit I [Treponema sp.]
MKKVFFAVQEKDQKDALKKLRKTGVMHLEITSIPSEGLTRAIEHKARAEDAMGIIRYFKPPKKKKSEHKKPAKERRHLDPAAPVPERPDLLKLMISLDNEHKELKARRLEYARAYDRVLPWGEFDPNEIRDLRSHGAELYLYSFFPEDFEKIPENIRYIKFDEDKATVRFATVGEKIPGTHHFRLPEKRLSEFKKDLDEVTDKLEKHQEKIKSFASRWPILKREMLLVNNRINLEEALANYTNVEGKLPEYNISYLKGYIPTEDVAKVKTAAVENNWALAIDDPAEDDAVPTKLKNPRAIKLLDPLLDFLDLTPGYREVDISLWFLLFFTIFFGMIFGDAGYGLLLFGATMFGIFKTAKKGVPAILKLLCLLSISNIAWGAINCAWFGIPIERLPSFLQDISLSYFNPAKNAYGQAGVDQNLKLLCFTLAAVHITIAQLHVLIKDIKRKSLKVFSDIASIGMLWGMYNVVLFLVASSDFRPFTIWPFTIHIIAAGVIINFFLKYYDGNIGKSIQEGLKNIFSVILGVSDAFSDIMSYIRLWAVGMAGAAISTMVTEMAGPMLGSFLIFLGIILLLFGHGLNIILTVLSVLVHGVRLNILEFSGRANLTWAGIRYKPFVETVKNI